MIIKELTSITNNSSTKLEQAIDLIFYTEESKDIKSNGWLAYSKLEQWHKDIVNIWSDQNHYDDGDEYHPFEILSHIKNLIAKQAKCTITINELAHDLVNVTIKCGKFTFNTELDIEEYLDDVECWFDDHCSDSSYFSSEDEWLEIMKNISTGDDDITLTMCLDDLGITQNIGNFEEVVNSIRNKLAELAKNYL